MTLNNGWRGRWLPERLLPAAEAGISIAAWNAWVAAQGGEGQAQLAGVPVGWLAHYAADAPVVADDAAGVANRLTERAQLLERLARWTLSDAAQGLGVFSRTVPGDARSFPDQVAHWRAHTTTLLHDLYTHADTAALLAALYFGAQPLLFPTQADGLVTVTGHAEHLVEVFNAAIAAQLATAPCLFGSGDMGEDSGSWRLDPEVVRGQVTERVRLAVDFLIDHATAQTLDEMGQGSAARALMERQLQHP